MPTNRNRRARKPKDDTVNEIPADLLHYLRYGHSREYRRAPGERISELYSDVAFFFFHEELFEWLQKAWEKHEALIREGMKEDPYIVELIQDERVYAKRWKSYTP